MEKKEQEVTAKNAQIHQQKIDSMEDFVVTRNAGEVNIESDIDEGQCDQLMLNQINVLTNRVYYNQFSISTKV